MGVYLLVQLLLRNDTRANGETFFPDRIMGCQPAQMHVNESGI